ncbi:DUF1439 domain-containing protein [Chitinasiproducens palmae]|nr:DUF1439 domain-containing protein [Chitinasiproducens palmae]
MTFDPLPRRRLLKAGVFAGLACALPGARSQTFPFIPQQYTFSRAQLQRAVERKFPYRQQVAQIADLTLTDPRLTLLPDNNRLAIDVAARVATALLAQPAAGALRLSATPAYDADARAIVLRNAAVDRIDMGDYAGPYTGQINTAIASLVQSLLENYPVHTFKPEELSFAGVHYRPGTMTVLRDGVRVTIVEQ